MIEVIAKNCSGTYAGFYGMPGEAGKRRRPGDRFKVHDISAVGLWMEPVDEKVKEKVLALRQQREAKLKESKRGEDMVALFDELKKLSKALEAANKEIESLKSAPAEAVGGPAPDGPGGPAKLAKKG